MKTKTLISTYRRGGGGGGNDRRLWSVVYLWKFVLLFLVEYLVGRGRRLRATLLLNPGYVGGQAGPVDRHPGRAPPVRAAVEGEAAAAVS